MDNDNNNLKAEYDEWEHLKIKVTTQRQYAEYKGPLLN